MIVSLLFKRLGSMATVVELDIPSLNRVNAPIEFINLLKVS